MILLLRINQYSQKQCEQISNGAFIRGRIWPINNNCYPLVFHERNTLLMASKVVGNEKYVWVQKQGLTDGHNLKGQNGGLKQGTSSNNSNDMSAAVAGVEHKELGKVSHATLLTSLRRR